MSNLKHLATWSHSKSVLVDTAGLNSAAEIFQRKLLEQLQDMKGIIIIADDLVVYGTNREEHDRWLHNLLQKCQTIGVKLNPEKLEIGLHAITFMGHRITKEGIVVDPEKVRAITDMPASKTIGDLRRFLGMINYVTKFIPNLTSVLKPLEDLTKKMSCGHGQIHSNRPSVWPKIW